MGRIYTAQFDSADVTTSQDLFTLVAGSAGIVQIHELGLSQKTEVADAAEEMLLIRLKSGQSITGAITSVTPTPLLVGDAASTASVFVNGTTHASGGTIVTHYSWYWNLRVPFQMIWTPETRPVLSPSRHTTVELAAAPADSVTMAGYIVWEEIG